MNMRFRRWASWIQVAFRGSCLIVLATACGAGEAGQAGRGEVEAAPGRGGTLYMVGSGTQDVDHLLSTSAYFSTTWRVMATFTRQLVTYTPSPDFNAHTQLVPDLAKVLPTRQNGGVSAGGLHYTFHLRSDARWNTEPARPVTAGDFVRAFKMMCNPVSPVPAPYYERTIRGLAEYCHAFARVPGTAAAIRAFVSTHEVDGVHALDDTTLTFDLRAQALDFVHLLSMLFASPVPEEYLDYVPDSPEFRRHTISAGPYQLVRYDPGRTLLLIRNPAWVPASDPLRSAYVDTIQVRLGATAEVVRQQILAGVADLSWDWQAAEVAPLLGERDARVLIAPGAAHPVQEIYVAINVLSPNNRGALADVRVRRALQFGVNKAALVRVMGGAAINQPLDQAVTPVSAGYVPGFGPYRTPGDTGAPERARALLREAGFPDGIHLKVWSEPGDLAKWNAVLQASLARAGIALDLVPINDAQVMEFLAEERLRAGTIDLAWGGWAPDWLSSSNGRSVIEPLFRGSPRSVNGNRGYYSNPAVDALIDSASVAATEQGAVAVWRRAARLVMEDAAIVPLVQGRVVHHLSARIRNCLPHIWSSFSCDLNNVAVRAAGQ
jgi:ABC-type transport system substrate-binding protein